MFKGLVSRLVLIAVFLISSFGIAAWYMHISQPRYDAEEERLRLKIFAMGGSAHREASPGYPVITMYLHSCEAINDQTIVIVNSFPKVRELTLAYTNISDKGLTSLNGLTHVQDLGLCYTNITDNGLVGLQDRFPSLNDLNLLGCTGITDRGLKNIEGIVKMKNASARRNQNNRCGLGVFARHDRVRSALARKNQRDR